MISFRLIRSCGKRRGSFFTALCFRRSRISFQTALQHSPENPVNSPCDFSVMQSTLPPSLFFHSKSNRKLYLFGFRSTKVPPAFLPFHCSCSKRRGSFFDADFARNCFSSRQPLTARCSRRNAGSSAVFLHHQPCAVPDRYSGQCSHNSHPIYPIQKDLCKFFQVKRINRLTNHTNKV